MENVGKFNPDEVNTIKEKFEITKKEFDELGGWKSFKSGEWLFLLIQKSFRNYYNKANAEYFQEKYASKDEEFIVKKLIGVTAKNSAILGAIVGGAVSTDEIIAIFTAGEGVIGLPANIAIAGAAIGAESILFIRFQLELIANIARAYNIPLDPDDPEDILTIMAFAIGGAVADEAGKFGMKIGGKLAARGVKSVIKKQVLAQVKRVAAKVGIKILQKTIIMYIVPLASIGVGSVWNYGATKAMGKIACKHFKIRRNEAQAINNEEVVNE